MRQFTLGVLAGLGLSLAVFSALGYVLASSAYEPAYRRIAEAKPMLEDMLALLESSEVEDMLSSYRELYSAIPKAEAMVEAYSEAYPVLIELSSLAQEVYDMSHSRQYNEVAAALEKIDEAASEVKFLLAAAGLTDLYALVDSASMAAELMREVKRFSEAAAESSRLLELIPPEELKAQVKFLKMIAEKLPPSKLEDMVNTARVNLRELSAFADRAERHPPGQVKLMLAAACTAGLALSAVSVASARRVLEKPAAQSDVSS